MAGRDHNSANSWARRRLAAALALSLAAVGCGDDGESSTGGGSDGTTTDAGTTGSTSSTSAQGTSTSADATGSSTTTDTTTTDATTSGSTGSSGGDGSSGTDGTGDGTSGGPAGPAYPACPSGDDSECGAGFNCIPLTDSGQVLASFCGDVACVPGGGGGECPVPQTGNASIRCAQFSTPVCTLTCDAGETCPDGMSCIAAVVDGVATDTCLWEP